MPDEPLPFERRLGAFPLGDGHAGFRVWAPLPERVVLRVGGVEHALEPVGYGVYEAVVEAAPGTDYEYLLDGHALPDPYSRWQPEGIRGPSRLLDTTAFEWSDADWSAARGRRARAVRAARRHVHGRGDVRRRRSRTCAGCASSASRRSS